MINTQPAPRATHRRGTAATRTAMPAANDNLPTNQDCIKALRQRGYSLRAIAAELGVSLGKVTRALYKTRRPAANDNNSVVRFVTSLGHGGSGTRQIVPIRLPRVTFIDGPYLGRKMEAQQERTAA